MTMKVVVIDDKPLIRRSIVETLDWEGLDCVVAADAEDGTEGKRVIEEHRPDIIITDIRMPGMDGLELAAFAKQRLSFCKVIVITGYQDFSYAKQCVRLGVFEYILKPLDNEELSDVVARAADELGRERREHLKRERLLPSAKRQYFADLISGRDSDRLPLAEEEGGARKFALFVVRNGLSGDWDGCEETGVDAAITEKIQSAYRHTRVAAEEAFRISLLNDSVHIVQFDRTVPDAAVERRMRRWGGALGAAFTAEEKRRYRFEWSGPIPDASRLRQHYVEAVRRLRLAFFKSSDAFGAPGDDPIKLSILQDIEKFRHELSAGLLASEEERIRAHLSGIAAYAAGNIAVAKSLIAALCMAVAKHYDNGARDGTIDGLSVDAILDRVNRLHDMEEAEQYLTTLLKAFRERNAQAHSGCSPLVKNILAFIDEHYHKGISLQAVAQQFHISAGHLSRLLRKETGWSFVDIVSRTKLEAAKRLLRDPTKRIQEVSELTGFKNYVYFYQVFKKYEGISPQEYKNKL